MKKGHLYFFLALFSLLSHSANAQTDSIRKIKPVLTLVSVQPETGFTELSWDPIPSSIVAGFTIRYFDTYFGPGWYFLETLFDPTILKYTDTRRISNSYSSYYVIEAIDFSGNQSIYSNELNTIFTKADIDNCNKKILVSWNSYLSIPKKVTGYTIMVSVNGGNYIETANVNSDKNKFSLSDFNAEAKYCFIVKANLEGGKFSTSNIAYPLPIVCKDSTEVIIDSTDVVTEPEIITVPNVFTPNNDEINDFFKPVLTFTPKDYHFIISNRRSNILFETRDYDEEWDGSQNGKPQPQGVYLWFLKVTTPSGKIISKTGTVTIINNPGIKSS